MTPETFRILVIVMSVWGILIAIKAANVLRSDGTYTFSMWDGGMLRAGKQLTKLGAQIKLAVGALMALGCILVFSQTVPVREGSYALIFVAILSLISDFVTVA